MKNSTCQVVILDPWGSKQTILFHNKHHLLVLRDTDKIIEQRQAKWRNFYRASGGKDVRGL